MSKLTDEEVLHFFAKGLLVEGAEKEEIAKAEAALNYKLPEAFKQLIARRRHGGEPARPFFATGPKDHRSAVEAARKPPQEEAPANGDMKQDYARIELLLGVNNNQNDESILGGRDYWVEQLGFPDIGVVCCTCEPFGDIEEAVICLDYSKCGRQGEPRVVYVQQDAGPMDVPQSPEVIKGLTMKSKDAKPEASDGKDFFEVLAQKAESRPKPENKITHVADDFAAFVRGLKPAEDSADNFTDDEPPLKKLRSDLTLDSREGSKEDGELLRQMLEKKKKNAPTPFQPGKPGKPGLEIESQQQQPSA